MVTPTTTTASPICRARRRVVQRDGVQQEEEDRRRAGGLIVREGQRDDEDRGDDERFERMAPPERERGAHPERDEDVHRVDVMELVGVRVADDQHRHAEHGGDQRERHVPDPRVELAGPPQQMTSPRAR